MDPKELIAILRQLNTWLETNGPKIERLEGDDVLEVGELLTQAGIGIRFLLPKGTTCPRCHGSGVDLRP